MSNISFILTYYHDTEERFKNFNLISNYYKELYPSDEFIVVETSKEKKLKNVKNITYIGSDASEIFNKSKAYNLGLAKANSDIVCFLDVDCIVSKESLDKAIEKSKNNSNIYIGYNGTCIYFEYNVKNTIKTNNLYDELIKFVDQSKLYTNYTNEYYLVGNTRAVGGCLIGQTKIFKEINGFNPNIIDWGFEDNEIVLRAHKLGHSPLFIQTSKPILLHLPHHNEKTDRSKHPFYSDNNEIYNKVISLTKDQLVEYIKTWKLI
jgi:predicted glycosyltransferase involved in capsule biosynthesis